MTGTITIDVHLDQADMDRALRNDVRDGLTASPKTLPPKWFYDEVGSQLFDDITRLPEYYPTRREREILEARSGAIARASGATALVELGSGTSTKTRLLLDALRDAGTLQTFAPFDCSESTLRDAGESIASRYPGIRIHGVVGDFERHLALLPDDHTGSRLVAFLGGTIGNLYVEERRAFLGALADSCEPGDWLLLGTDLVKDADRLITAYDDPGGVTERFVRNGLRVLNRELGADFDPGGFSYVPFWDRRLHRMDLRLRAESPMDVHIPGAGVELHLASGEEIRMEISTKFTIETIRDELGAVGFDVVHSWTDAGGDFAVTLARRLEG
jgi:L-histidine N-alpha-methyltransferase